MEAGNGESCPPALLLMVPSNPHSDIQAPFHKPRPCPDPSLRLHTRCVLVAQGAIATLHAARSGTPVAPLDPGPADLPRGERLAARGVEGVDETQGMGKLEI